jgi:Spy/CpxP family protein refolding chaperone
MKRTWLGFLLVMSGAAWAEEPRDPFEGMQTPKRMLRGAMLSETQVAQIRELRKTQWAEDKQLQAKLKTLWEQLDEKLTAGGPADTAELTALEDECEELQAESNRGKFKIMLQVRALLTAEQLRRVAQTHQKERSLNAQLRGLEPTIAGEAP